MEQELSKYGGLAFSFAFGFAKWAWPTMPKPVAWSGIIGGAMVFIACLIWPDMKISAPAILLFLAGSLCYGGAWHFAFSSAPKPEPTKTENIAPTHSIGDVKDNQGIITQGQHGDNAIHR
jgi:hypothetical protein